MMYIRYPRSLRQVEDVLFERGIDISHETAGSKGIPQIFEAGNAADQERNRWLNNRAGNSHQPRLKPQPLQP